MTYYEAAVQILRAAQHPLSTREITDRAKEQKLIRPGGKTPQATMSAVLYGRQGSGSVIVKIDEPGTGRAKRGSVRWALRDR